MRWSRDAHSGRTNAPPLKRHSLNESEEGGEAWVGEGSRSVKAAGRKVAGGRARCRYYCTGPCQDITRIELVTKTKVKAGSLVIAGSAFGAQRSEENGLRKDM
jgi:hypothetical protein